MIKMKTDVLHIRMKKCLILLATGFFKFGLALFLSERYTLTNRNSEF
jgi:hypothetical protein